MTTLTLTTFAWVPEPPRGFVRDIRARWALEEAKLPYRVDGVPFKDRGAEHLKHQPFGQVPWLTDGDISIFESGAILLHIAQKSDALMPVNAINRSEVTSWLLAALNSVEMASLPQALYNFAKDKDPTPGRKLDGFLAGRLDTMEKILAKRTWLTGTFSVADIMMADVLRLVEKLSLLSKHPACQAYVERATARPAFKKAYDDQIAFFAAADGTQAAQ